MTSTSRANGRSLSVPPNVTVRRSKKASGVEVESQPTTCRKSILVSTGMAKSARSRRRTTGRHVSFGSPTVLDITPLSDKEVDFIRMPDDYVPSDEEAEVARSEVELDDNKAIPAIVVNDLAENSRPLTNLLEVPKSRERKSRCATETPVRRSIRIREATKKESAPAPMKASTKKESKRRSRTPKRVVDATDSKKASVCKKGSVRGSKKAATGRKLASNGDKPVVSGDSFAPRRSERLKAKTIAPRK